MSRGGNLEGRKKEDYSNVACDRRALRRIGPNYPLPMPKEEE